MLDGVQGSPSHAPDITRLVGNGGAEGAVGSLVNGGGGGGGRTLGGGGKWGGGRTTGSGGLLGGVWALTILFTGVGYVICWVPVRTARTAVAILSRSEAITRWLLWRLFRQAIT